MRCEYAHSDASYVLGALSPAERTDYERHLTTCPECREAVAEIAVLPGLLARLDAITAEELHYGALSGPPPASRTFLDATFPADLAFPVDLGRPDHTAAARDGRPDHAAAPRDGRPDQSGPSREAGQAADAVGHPRDDDAHAAHLADAVPADLAGQRDAADRDAAASPDDGASVPGAGHRSGAAHLANPAHLGNPAYVEDRAHLANAGHPRNPAHRGGAARTRSTGGLRAAPRPIARPGEPRRPSPPAGRGRRSRLRYLAGGLVAAGLAVAVGMATWTAPRTTAPTASGAPATSPPSNRAATPPSGTPRLVPMVPASRDVPLRAEIALSRHGYGTKIRMTCRYLDVGGNPPTWTVSLLAYGPGDEREQVGSWVAEPGGQVPFEGITRFAGNQLKRVEVVRSDTGEKLITHDVR